MSEVTLDQLQAQVDQVGDDLLALKDETDAAIQKNKLKEVDIDAKSVKKAINKELAALKASGNATTTEVKEKIAKLETMLATVNTSMSDLVVLRSQIITTSTANTAPSTTPSTTTQNADTQSTTPPTPPSTDDKSRLRKQRDGVMDKDERKNNTRTNVARTAVGGLGVAVLAGLTWKGIKRMFGIGKNKDKDKDKSENKDESDDKQTDNEDTKDKSDDHDEDDEHDNKKKSSRWKRMLGGVGVSAGGYLLYRLLKGKGLSFEDALIQAEADLANISESDEINIDRGKITYDASVKQIKTYGLGTVIDKGNFFKAKKIEGLDLKFSDYKQLIHAANLVNYIKHKYTGRCLTDAPFYTKTLTGDIYIKIKSGNNDTSEEEIISGGMFSTLSQICPDVLNGIFKDTDNKDKFLAYLNKQGCWKEGNVQAPDANGDKVQEKMNEAYQEIIDTPSDFDPQGAERGQIITTPTNPDKTEYTVNSRGTPPQKTKIKLTVDADGNITSGKIEGLSIEFTDLEQLLRTANLINKLKYQYHVTNPLNLDPGEDAFYRTNSFGLIGGHPGIYADRGGWQRDQRAVTKESLENTIPTVYTNKEIFIKYMNAIKDKNGKGFWETGAVQTE